MISLKFQSKCKRKKLFGSSAEQYFSCTALATEKDDSEKLFRFNIVYDS